MRGTTAETGAAVGGAALATSELKTGLSATAAGAGPDGSVEEAVGADADAGGDVRTAGDVLAGGGDGSGGGIGALDAATVEEGDEVDGDVDAVSGRRSVGVTDGTREAATAASRER